MEIITYEGVGPIRFGMTSAQVQDVMQDTPRRFLKSLTSGLKTEAYRNDSVHVYYRSPGVTEAVELFKPANPTISGKPLIDVPYSEVRKWFLGQDADLAINEAGFVSKKLGISIYAPSARKDAHAPVEAIMVFERGYYDR